MLASKSVYPFASKQIKWVNRVSNLNIFFKQLNIYVLNIRIYCDKFNIYMLRKLSKQPYAYINHFQCPNATIDSGIY